MSTGTSNDDLRRPIVIIGGGLTGLACATTLGRRGVPCVLIEASDRLGGRLATDRTPDGFLIDKGFQVYLTAYPYGRALLDYDALNFRAFVPGALVWREGAFHRIVDPLRRPRHAAATAFNPLVTFGDVGRVLKLRYDVGRGTPQGLFDRPETDAATALRRRGFSTPLIESFFRPFFGGVFLDRTLATSSRLLEFTFRMFATGRTVLPADGIAAIPRQLTERLPSCVTVRLNARVATLDSTGAWLRDGERVDGRAVVIAADAPAATRLIDASPDLSPPTGSHAVDSRASATVTLSFAARRSPTRGEPILVLDGDGTGPVNHLAVVSDVASSYAPNGQSLVSASVVGGTDEPPDTLQTRARRQMREWFGREVDDWRFLSQARLPFALPDGRPGRATSAAGFTPLAANVYAAGDWQSSGSTNAALGSGIAAAEAILDRLRPGKDLPDPPATDERPRRPFRGTRRVLR